MIEIEIKNQTIQLLPQRAVYWVNKKTLIVADLHLGKAAALQNAGLAIPEGAMENDLYNLKALIKNTNAEKCIVVGDLIHSKEGLSERILSKFREWIADLPCSFELVVGNHDRAIKKKLPEGWNFIIHLENLLIDPFCFSHFPAIHAPYFVWCGHLHPQYKMKSYHDQLTLRCFLLTPMQGILPAFSDFVGGTYVKRTALSQIYVIAHQYVINV